MLGLVGTRRTRFVWLGPLPVARRTGTSVYRRVRSNFLQSSIIGSCLDRRQPPPKPVSTHTCWALLGTRRNQVACFGFLPVARRTGTSVYRRVRSNFLPYSIPGASLELAFKPSPKPLFYAYLLGLVETRRNRFVWLGPLPVARSTGTSVYRRVRSNFRQESILGSRLDRR